MVGQSGSIQIHYSNHPLKKAFLKMYRYPHTNVSLFVVEKRSFGGVEKSVAVAFWSERL